MKKILALLLSLMFLLPAAAMAEAASDPETYTVDFEDFSITIHADDVLQKGEKADNQILFILFPDYDESSLFHSNINSLWTAEDMSVLGDYGAEAFGQTVLAQSADQLAAQGIAVSNQQLIAAEFDAESKTTTLITSMDADYTAMGYDLVMTLCQVQMYIPMGEGGSYIFTISADSLDSAYALLDYMDTVMFAE